MALMRFIIVLLLISKSYAIDNENTTTTSTSDSTSISTTLKTTDASQSTTLQTTTESTVSPTTTPIEVPKFIVKDDKSACIILEGKLSISISYNIDKKIVSENFDIGSSVTTSGSCGEQKQMVTLSWFPGAGVPFSLNFSFTKLPASPSSQDVVVDSIILNYTLSDKVFPGTKDNGSRIAEARGEFFKMPTSSFLTCMPSQVISLDGTNEPIANLTVSSLKVEAFRNSTSEEFIGNSYDCVITPPTNNTIPIAVGVSFAILIILAVIAFLIGNRRRQQGYQTI